jgi:2',3'-cyclic-nucleotide 2'-phosphodiesterase (5'-nucleotidase family)
MRMDMKIRLVFCIIFACSLSVLADVVHVRIVQTTDLHGQVVPDAEAGASWLRAAKLIETQRQRFGAENVVLVDCGDTVQGSFEAYVTGGEIAAKLLDAMEYDVWVPGNHEIDFGTERFLELTEIVGHDRIVCNNFRVLPRGEGGAAAVGFLSWKLIERAGAKIAVIGATASYLDNWHWGREVTNYEVVPALDVLGGTLAEIHEVGDIDMIVLAIHQGWMAGDDRGVNEVAEIARRFPEIDLILGGHTHRQFAGMPVGNSVWYMQAGKHGDSIGVVDAIVDTDMHETLNIRSVLEPVDESVGIPERAFESVRELYAAALAAADEVVGTVGEDITPYGMPGIDCAMSELFCRALVEASGADFAIHGTLSDAALNKGVVTHGDLFAVVPYENGIGVAELTPEELKVIVHEQCENRESYVACGIYGFQADLGANGFVNNLRDLRGRALDPEKRYKVAFNSYTVAGGGGRFPQLRRLLRRPEANLAEVETNSREALRDYLKKHPGISVAPTKWLHVEEAMEWDR